VDSRVARGPSLRASCSSLEAPGLQDWRSGGQRGQGIGGSGYTAQRLSALELGTQVGRLHWVRRPSFVGSGVGCAPPIRRDASWAMGTQRRGVAGTLLTAAGGTPFGDDAPAPLPAPTPPAHT
ncbi:hypothetical protein CF319_g9587, partial [Tilletia indica]